MKGRMFNLNACLTRARIALQDGRVDEGVEELRRGIFESARIAPPEGRSQAEEILRFARENDNFSEVEESLDDEPLRRQLFGPE